MRKEKRERAAANSESSVLSSEQCRMFLVDCFPGRKHEIEELLSLLGEPSDVFPPLHLYGAAATGKTSVVRETMACLQRPFAYVSCRSCRNPRLLFESVLNQLVGHVRCKRNNYASTKKCERMIDFISELEGACAAVLSRKSGGDGPVVNLGEKARDVVYIIFDDVELIRAWVGGAVILSSLVSLSDLTKLPNLGLVFISNSGPDSLQFGSSSRDLVPLHFRTYTNEELHSILVKWHPVSDLYPSFLKTSLPPFCRASRSLTELFNGLRPLFEKFCQPLFEGNSSLDKSRGSRELFSHLRGHLQPALSQTYSISVSPDPGNEKASKETKKDCVGKLMEFTLSHCSKYLLLASYIASQNPSTLDDALFGAGDTTKSRKRTRRSSMSAMEKKDADLQEKRLKGPSNCPLERLLAIYKCVASEGALALEEGKEGSIEVAHEEDRTSEITSDVLMELATLTSVNLILRNVSSPLEGVPRFRSNVDSDFIHKVAQSIQFPLSKYLLNG